MEDADQGVERGGTRELGPGDREDVADEHLLQVLGLARRLRHHEDGAGRGHGVGDSDDRLLGDARLPVDAGEGEDRGAEHREGEREDVGGGGVEVVAGQVAHRPAERGDLRER